MGDSTNMSINRFVCSVLDEMRTAVKIGRIDMLVGLVEEVQTLVNRMEAKLADYSDMGYDLAEHQKNKKRIKAIDAMCDKWEARLEAVTADLDDDEAEVEIDLGDEDEPTTVEVVEVTPEMIDEYRVEQFKIARSEMKQEQDESWDRTHTRFPRDPDGPWMSVKVKIK